MAKKTAKKTSKKAKAKSKAASGTKASSKKAGKKIAAAKSVPAAKKATTKKTAVKPAAKVSAKKSGGNGTIAVDFDGVLHRYSKGFADGTIYDPPVPGAREAMEELKAAGYKLYIFSTRSNKIFRKKDDPDQNEAMKAWLEKHSIPFDRIWAFGKPMADIYLDDRAIGFRGDWNATMKEIRDFKPWTQG